MRYAAGACCALLLFAASPAAAQTAPKKTAEQIQAAYTAHKGDFDYLLGDWTFTAKSREFGMFEGRWSAVRLSTGQILDEYRIVGNGETIYVTTTIRNFNSVSDRWELIGMDQANGLQDFGTAQRVGSEMRIEQRFGVAGGNAVVMRIRYHHIEAATFSWAADRSTDGGKTWVTDYQTIEAKRIGPARSMAALTKP